MKKIFPKDVKHIILSQEETVRIGKHEIGWWSKEVVESTSHFRPSPNEGKNYYTAKLTNDAFLQCWSREELREAIFNACKDGIIPEDDDDE